MTSTSAPVFRPTMAKTPEPAVSGAASAAVALSAATNAMYAQERMTLMTFNVWNTEQLALRTKAINRLLHTFPADVICLQEVRPEILTLFDAALPSHARVTDKDKPWNYEGNIYWNSAIFDCLRFGAADVGMVEPHRRLFWVKLQNRSTKRVVVVCTAHLTWEGSAHELVTGASPRNEQTHRIAEFCRAIDPDFCRPPPAATLPYPVSAKVVAAAAAANPAAADADAAVAVSAAAVLADGVGVDGVVVCGDLNDRFHPRRVLRAECGLIDAFGQLSVPLRSTWPTPSFRFAEDDRGGVDIVADWVFTHPQRLRAVTAQIVECADANTYPSDHFPLLAVLQPTCPAHATLLDAQRDAADAAEFKRATALAAQQLLRKATAQNTAAAAAAAAGPAAGTGAAIAVTVTAPAGSKAPAAASGFDIPAGMIKAVRAARPKRTDDQIKAALIDCAFDVSAAIKALS